MIQIYGASDDLVEIEGDIYEEFTLPPENMLYLGLSNGYVVSVSYDGDWTVRVKHNLRGYNLYPAGTDSAIQISGRDFTDVLQIDEIIDWVLPGTEVVFR